MWPTSLVHNLTVVGSNAAAAALKEKNMIIIQNRSNFVVGEGERRSTEVTWAPTDPTDSSLILGIPNFANVVEID